MMADCEDLHKSEASVIEIYVKGFKSQDVFVKGEHKFPCTNETLLLPNRPRPSLIREGNLELEDDVDTEEGDKKGRKKEDA